MGTKNNDRDPLSTMVGWILTAYTFVGGAALVASVIGCSDAPTTTDVPDFFGTVEYCNRTSPVAEGQDPCVEEDAGSETTATDSLSEVDDAEVATDPCADYHWIVGETFQCCNEGDTCEWENGSCVVYETDGTCFFQCDVITNGFEVSVGKPTYVFDPPRVVKHPEENPITCTLSP